MEGFLASQSRLEEERPLQIVMKRGDFGVPYGGTPGYIVGT